MEQIPIRDEHQQIVGYIEDYGTHKEVRNKNRELVGRVIDGKTYNRYGAMISFQEHPGLLFAEF